MWAGDQLTTWDQHDALQSAMITLLNSGLMGLSNIHTDTGGYTSFEVDIGKLELFKVDRSKELLWRWMEFSAFTLTYRTHEGMFPEANYQVYDDEETMKLLCELSVVFECLKDYRDHVMLKYEDDGVPIYKHLELEYPLIEERVLNEYGLEEYLFGSDFLVAPVMKKGEKDKKVYFPGDGGEWVDVWTEKVYKSGSEFHFMNIIHGQPPVFFKKGNPFGEDFLKCIPKRKTCTT